jgi:hypothetical protein
VVSREWYRTAMTAPTLNARIASLAKGSARLMTSAADVIAVAREAEATEPQQRRNDLVRDLRIRLLADKLPRAACLRRCDDPGGRGRRS